MKEELMKAELESVVGGCRCVCKSTMDNKRTETIGFATSMSECREECSLRPPLSFKTGKHGNPKSYPWVMDNCL